MNKIINPYYNLNAFNCPHCRAYSEQIWSFVYTNYQENGNTFYSPLKDCKIADCRRCKKYSIWLSEEMVYPIESTAPEPNHDLPVEIKADYIEASNIVQLSPRGASAILRLALQKLCKHLGEKGEHLDTDIKSLVNKGLNTKLLKAMEIVRVIGNNSVHPGEIRMDDDIDTANKLFSIINIICTDLITNPKEIDSLFQEKMPEKIKKKLV